MSAIEGSSETDFQRDDNLRDQNIGGADRGQNIIAVDVPQAAVPQICINNKMLPEAVTAAIQAMCARNQPPSLFLHASQLVKAGTAGSDVTLTAMGISEMTCELAYAAHWFESTSSGIKGIYPPALVVKAVLMQAAMWAFPLSGIVRIPTFAPGWRPVTHPGYDFESQLLYAPNHGTIAEVPQTPSDAEVAAARQLIGDELLGEFPFRCDADRAAVVAAIIVPFVRGQIEGATPLHLIESPEPGSGKTLLADVIAIPALGMELPATTEIENADDLRKSITSMAMTGDTIFLLDNINAKLGGAALASALTKIFWSDRIIGTSRQAKLSLQALWLATGNNVTVTPEMIRRIVRCRIDPGIPKPYLRTGFKHADLRAWAKFNREALIHAILVLVQNWLARGRPDGGVILGSFESYCQVIGGILASAGIDGFLADLESDPFADDQTTEWTAFVLAWHEKFGSAHIHSGALDEEILKPNPEMLATTLAAAGSSRGRWIKLGQELRKKRDAIVGGYRVRISNTVDGHGCWDYWLEDPGTANPGGTSASCNSE
jgi:hypothetical protein